MVLPTASARWSISVPAVAASAVSASTVPWIVIDCAAVSVIAPGPGVPLLVPLALSACGVARARPATIGPKRANVLSVSAAVNAAVAAVSALAVLAENRQSALLEPEYGFGLRSSRHPDLLHAVRRGNVELPADRGLGE